MSYRYQWDRPTRKYMARKLPGGKRTGGARPKNKSGLQSTPQTEVLTIEEKYLRDGWNVHLDEGAAKRLQLIATERRIAWMGNLHGE